MKNNCRWVIIDVETDGLYQPIHIVEIAAQLMNGWDPAGKPFRMLLNHDVPIAREVVAVHGYTQEFLRKNGEDPRYAYELFREYAMDYPFVAHNLSFDWNRCLVPEWSRLGVTQIGRRGFCAMTLARRVVRETRTFKLDALTECFNLARRQSHRAENDVLTLADLFQHVYRPRLEHAQLETFESISKFSRQTPVAGCLKLFQDARPRQVLERNSGISGPI